MSKAEQFIKDCTRRCSNETTTLGSYDHTYHEWLTPEQALAAVEIAREEMIDTIEVKEVDLDKERRKYFTEHFNVYEDGILQSKRSCMPLDTFDIIQVAKHFFKLGLKAQKGGITMAIIEKCIICEEPATMHIHGDAYCSECGKEMKLKILHHAFSI